jgi:hypothetical protein
MSLYQFILITYKQTYLKKNKGHDFLSPSVGHKDRPS